MLSVGELLKKTRENKNLTLKQVEKELRVRSKFLNAIENNNWLQFSSQIYIGGIIKNYARLLNLNEDKILAFFRREYEKKDDDRFKRKYTSKYLTPVTKKYLSRGIILLCIFFFGYFIFQLKLFLTPPTLTIIEPKNYIVGRTDRVKIIAKTEKEATIFIFGERIYQNRDGIFEYTLPLEIGLNNFKIELIGANGQKTNINKQFIRER